MKGLSTAFTVLLFALAAGLPSVLRLAGILPSDQRDQNETRMTMNSARYMQPAPASLSTNRQSF
jgi:hypothetical protein